MNAREVLAELVREIDALEKKATVNPWKATCAEHETEAEPSLWRIHGGDDSLEATICELWSGEHDNESCAKLITVLRNAWPQLRGAVLAQPEAREELIDIVLVVRSLYKALHLANVPEHAQYDEWQTEFEQLCAYEKHWSAMIRAATEGAEPSSQEP
jgi:hypothetical protein